VSTEIYCEIATLTCDQETVEQSVEKCGEENPKYKSYPRAVSVCLSVTSASNSKPGKIQLN